MKKTSAGQPKGPESAAAVPAGRRSGKGSSSVVPYLEEARSSKPVPLEPLEDVPPSPRKRSFWRRR